LHDGQSRVARKRTVCQRELAHPERAPGRGDLSRVLAWGAQPYLHDGRPCIRGAGGGSREASLQVVRWRGIVRSSFAEDQAFV